MFESSKLTRRTFLASTSAAAAYGLAGTVPAFADVNWKKYAGTKIGVNLVKSPRGDTLQKYEKRVHGRSPASRSPPSRRRSSSSARRP